MSKRVAIIGSHPRTRGQFDFSRTDCRIWVFNEALADPSGWCKRADVVFQMHRAEIWRNPNNRNDPNHYKWLQSGDTPLIIMQDVYPDVPKSRKYPLEQIIEKFGRKEFTSSAAYALAMAIYDGYDEIEIYGVELETDTEYRYQREAFALWFGMAIGLGIKVTYHGTIFDAPLYGYEGEAYLPYETFENRLAELQPTIKMFEGIYAEKQKQANSALLRFGESHGGVKDIPATIKEQIAAGYNFGVADGARQENERYKRKADAMKEASGNFLFSRQEFEQAAQGHYKKLSELQGKANVLAGVCQERLKDADVENRERRRKRMQDLAVSLKEYIETSIYAGIFAGAYQENVSYMQRLDALIKAAGGEKSEAVLLAAQGV